MEMIKASKAFEKREELRKGIESDGGKCFGNTEALPVTSEDDIDRPSPLAFLSGVLSNEQAKRKQEYAEAMEAEKRDHGGYFEVQDKGKTDEEKTMRTY